MCVPPVEKQEGSRTADRMAAPRFRRTRVIVAKLWKRVNIKSFWRKIGVHLDGSRHCEEAIGRRGNPFSSKFRGFRPFQRMRIATPVMRHWFAMTTCFLGFFDTLHWPMKASASGAYCLRMHFQHPAGSQVWEPEHIQNLFANNSYLLIDK